MIKFFRKIRQKLLSKGETGKYFKYAIGEIVLVVIGILIALSINNWNETRKQLVNEVQLYSKLYDDLNSEYIRIERNARQFKGYSRSYTHIYNETIGEAEFMPGINYDHLLWFHRYNMFINEKYSESFAIITNDEIYQKLKSFTSVEKETNYAINEWNENQLKVVRPYLSKHGINKTEAIFNNELDGFMEIINQTELIEYSKLKEQYGSLELNQLLFTMQFKTTWALQNLVLLNKNNLRFQNVLKKELELHGVTENIIIWEKKKKNIQLLSQADAFYNTEDYLKSANKFMEAFSLMEYGSSNDRYNAACSFALAEDIESAFDQLFIIARNPFYYNDYNWITKDTDLKILHTDQRWNELISIIKLNQEKEEDM